MKLPLHLERLRSSFWFTPALIVLGSILLAAALVELEVRTRFELASWSPRLFGAGASGSRAMLSAIATSMVTVAGVVFSITIVSLSLTSTQYSPRVLRNFMRDAPTQVVLGLFLGAYAYCLVVLRTIRGGDEGVFIPSVAVLGGIVYALVGVGVLIFFIHHVALGIQASSILHRIAADTASAIDHLFPQEVGDAPAPRDRDVPIPSTWTSMPAARGGYVESIDADALLAAAIACGRVLRLRVSIGEYLPPGRVLVEAAGGQALPGEDAQRIRNCVLLGRHRSVRQDAAFGFQQLVDVALRALSTGINDPTTACMCLNEVATLLATLARRSMPASLRFEAGQLRVIAPAPDFGVLAAEALRPIVQHSGGNVQVLAGAIAALEIVAEATADGERRRALRQLALEVQSELSGIRPPARAKALRRPLRALLAALAADPAGRFSRCAPARTGAAHRG